MLDLNFHFYNWLASCHNGNTVDGYPPPILSTHLLEILLDFGGGWIPLDREW